MKGPRGNSRAFSFCPAPLCILPPSMPLTATALRLQRPAIALAFLFLFAVHAAVIFAFLNHPTHLDETEQLQASIMLARGERMYKDFAEHHPPFFSELLSTFAPVSSGE